MPPLHPALVHYPVALTAVAIVADSVAAAADISSLLPVGSWGLAIAAGGAVIAAGAGYADMKRNDLEHETHEIVHLHMKSGFVLAVALVVAAVWRWLLPEPSIAYLVVGWIIVAGVAVQAWLGGEIVYAHGGGVAAAGQGTSDPHQAKGPSRRFYHMLMGKYPSPGKDEGGSTRASMPGE